MKLLVTGGAGFIGSNFIRHMLETHPDIRIVNFDKLTYAGNLKNLEDVEKDPRYTFVQGDITDLEALNKTIQDHGLTHAINFAAETHVDRSIHGGCKDFVLTNSLGVQMILDAVRTNNIQKFVNVSTDEVYGSLELNTPDRFTEDTPIAPNMPYAAAKSGGDMMCRAYFMTHKVPVVVTHCSNNYGPYQFPEKLIPFFVFKLLKGEKVPVYGDGLNVRDWIHVKDHARALDILLQKGVAGEVYNIGVDNERNNLEITRMILELMGLGEDKMEFITDRPGHDRRYAIDARKIEALGWSPLYTKDKFRQGLAETIHWYRTHTDWVENLWEKKRTEMNKFQNTLTRSTKEMPVDVAGVGTTTSTTASLPANNLVNPILIFGNGFLGKRLAELLPNTVITSARIDDKAAVLRAIDEYKPSAIINAAGRNGTPNVDWCETHQVETYHTNVIGTLTLAEACQEKNVYLVHLGSGCIFYGNPPDAAGWKEEDATNPSAFYSRTKYAADMILSRLPNTAIARLRLPVDFVPSPNNKNLIDKLSSYKKVIDVENSVTIVEDLADVIRQLIEKKATGIFHCTNPGALKYRHLIEMYRAYVDPNHTNEWIEDQDLAKQGLAAKNRSTTILQSTRLEELGIHMRPIAEGFRATMEKYAPLKRAQLAAKAAAEAAQNAPQTTAAPTAPQNGPAAFPHFTKEHKPEMKGLIAAGGLGTRLAPLTNITNKHLLPVHNRPMILYPLQTLLDAGIRNVMIVTGPEYAHQFVKLLGSGSQFGCQISYRIQDGPGGIAQAVSMGEDFVGRDNVTVILGDNLFEDNFHPHISQFKGGAMTFYRPVADPQRFGVVEVGPEGRVLSIEEKPKNPKSNFAQVGLYVYDSEVFEIIKGLKPSDRNQLEIVDANNGYLRQGRLTAHEVKGFWSDAGTFPSLKRATEFFASKDNNII